MGKIKVLHIAQSNGGVAEYLKMFFKYANKSKYELFLICSNDYLHDDILELRNYAKKIFKLSLKREINVIEDIISLIEINTIVRSLKPDIIHCHSSKGGVYGRIVARINGIKCIYNSHGWAFNMDVSNKKKNIYAFIERYLSKYTDKIVNISKYEQESAIRNKICSADKMKIINNGIDLSVFTKSENRVGYLEGQKNKFIIGMVARICETKDPFTFVKIAQRIKRIIPNSFFIIVGDGELKDKVEEFIKDLELKDDIFITGWVKNVREYVQYFDVALLTSRWEGFGLVLTEYMASGKPIVASRVGGIPNVIKNRVSGLLAQAENPDDFVEKILLLKNDEYLRKSIIINSKIEVNKYFNIERVVMQHEQLYKEIIESNGKG